MINPFEEIRKLEASHEDHVGTGISDEHRRQLVELYVDYANEYNEATSYPAQEAAFKRLCFEYVSASLALFLMAESVNAIIEAGEKEENEG